MKSKYYLPLLLLIVFPSIANCGLVVSSHNDTASYTPLMAAALSCDLLKTQQEFEKDPSQINIKDTDMDEATALHDAVNFRCYKVTAYLLDNHGADVNAKETNGFTPLHLAARNGDGDIIILLLKNHAEINDEDSTGRTPLDRALQRNHLEAASLLRANGAQEGSAH